MNNIVIVIRKAAREEIKKKLGCSYSTISDALNYRRDSEQCAKIRCMAVNNYNGIQLKI